MVSRGWDLLRELLLTTFKDAFNVVVDLEDGTSILIRTQQLGENWPYKGDQRAKVYMCNLDQERGRYFSDNMDAFTALFKKHDKTGVVRISTGKPVLVRRGADLVTERSVLYEKDEN
jgi:hypothetical protein